MNRQNLSTSSFKGKKGAVIVTAKFILLWAAVFAFFFLAVAPEYLNGYDASLIDKVSRLQSVSGPKIVLIGNSNLAFGIRSEMMEEAFGMPVVNMGLHGGAGNAFHEEMAKLNVQEGDIVIVCHSDFGDDDTLEEDEASLLWIIVENHRNLWKLIRFKDIPVMIKTFPVYIKKASTLFLSGMGNRADGSSYDRNAFNEYGDNIYSETHPESFVFQENMVCVPQISNECVDRLNRLNRFLEQRGAVMLVAGYPIGDGEYTPPKEDFDAFEKRLREKLDCEVISHYRDYFIGYEYFYNTLLHLNDEGAKIRTAQLIDDLKRYFVNAALE